MRLIGFGFNKISVEKFKDKIENLKIDSKINISDVRKLESSFVKTEEELIEVKFTYNLEYNLDIAKIDFSGNVLFATNSEESGDIYC